MYRVSRAVYTHQAARAVHFLPTFHFSEGTGVSARDAIASNR